MTEVVTVKLRHDMKLRWFVTCDPKPQTGDHVIVETDRGCEMGLVCEDVCEVSDEQIAELPSPLKPVKRVATDEDLARADELAERAEETMPLFRELVDKHGLDMKPVRVEYLFDGDKAVFYFSAEQRVDFRDLVRELAGRLHLRIDMRQIGVRDEARMVGGISHCGEELCCTRFGGEFKPVSIRMAKEQDLPLNPASISGVCGRLMCCLRYEFEAYKDFKSRAPKKGALIDTPLGKAKVCEFNIPEETVTMRLEDGKQVTVPLGEMSLPEDAEPNEEGRLPRPCMVDRETLERHANATIAMALSALDREKDGGLEDKTADHASGRKPRSQRRRRQGTQTGRAPEDGKDRDAPVEGKAKAPAEAGNAGQDGQKRQNGRRRRRGRGSGGAGKASGEGGQEQRDGARKSQGSPQGKQDGSPQQKGAQPPGNHEKPRRRSRGRGHGREGGEGGAPAHGSDAAKPKVRPGQHSSGMRNARAQGAGHRPDGAGHPQGPSDGRRTPRRRHSSGGGNKGSEGKGQA